MHKRVMCAEYSILLVLFGFPILTCADSSMDTQDSTGVVFTKSPQTLGDTRTFGLAIEDVDLDNDQDVFIANLIGPSKLWLNDGHGNFTQSSQVFDVPAVHDVGMADFNGDTYPDIFLLSHDSPSKIYLNAGDGTFLLSNQNIGSIGDYPQYIDLGDIDNDGDIDALIYNWQSVPNILCINDGAGNFTIVNIDYWGSDAKGFELADFNGDSFLDVFVNIRDNPNQIWLNDETGNFINSNHSFGNGGEYTDCIDFDNDGDMDIAITNPGSGVTIWLNQNNTGTFIAGHSIAEGATHCKLIDVELDGDFDLITTDLSNGNKLWLNDGTGSFISLGQIFGNSHVLSVDCGDIDGDGDDDVIFGQLEGTGGNSVYFDESVLIGIDKENSSGSINYKLHNNFPNPFNPTTKLRYDLPEQAFVQLAIYDLLGRQVTTLVNRVEEPGYRSVTWNGTDAVGKTVSAGMYLYVIKAGDFVQTRKMILLK